MTSYLENLPELPFVLILKKLGQNEVRKCRLLSRTLKGRMEDLFMDWRFFVDDIYTNMCLSRHQRAAEFLAPLLTLKAKGVLITHLPKDLQPQSEGCIFKYPELLKFLQCGHERMTFEVSPEHVEILLRTSTNLQDLQLRFPSDIINSSICCQSKFSFKNLRSLDMGVCNDRAGLVVLRDVNLFCHLLQSELPAVTSITLDMSGVQIYSSLKLREAFFTFLERQGRILKSVKFGAEETVDDELQSGYGFLNTCTTLEKMELFEDGAKLSNAVWKRLVQNQTELKSLSVQAKQSFRAFCTTILPCICKSLETLVITNLEVELLPLPVNQFHRGIMNVLQLPRVDQIQGNELDMAVFRTCPNLKRLTLHRPYENAHITLRNLNVLPLGIEALSFRYLRIDAADLLQFCSDKNRAKFHKIMLCRTDSIVPSGLTGQILRELMKLPSLTRIGFSCGGVKVLAGEEGIMEDIYGKVGHQGIHEDDDKGFYMFRDNVSTKWEVSRRWSNKF